VAGDTEVGHLAVTVGLDQHVGRFDVTVDEPELVRLGEGLSDLSHDHGHALGGQLWVLGELLAQRAPPDQLHHEKGRGAPRGIRELTGVMHLHDPVGAEHGRDASLCPQAVGSRGVGQVRTEDLHRDLATQDLVVGAPDLTHTAHRDQAGELVTPCEALPGCH
jgi:hypothetical protein